MRRHFNQQGELYAVTLSHSEWSAVDDRFRSTDDEAPALRTWCPKRGAVTVPANVVSFGHPAAKPEGFEPPGIDRVASRTVPVSILSTPAEERFHVDTAA